MPVPTDNTVYIDFILSKSTSEDDKGYIIEAEVSNEGLDQQEQIVLQRALLDSKDYFLRNGVISFDHLHGQKQDPRYIIGEPIDVYTKGTSTFVRGRLFRNNEFAEDIVNKLKNNAKVIRSSVGGLKPVIVNEYDAKLKRPVEKVVSVLWNDWAVTAKPVLDNLSPVRLVKSLMAGYVTDSATATGGGALGVQDLEGADRKKKAIHAVITAIAVGDVKTPEDGLSVLADNGVESKEASDILEEVVNRRRKLQEVFRMDANLTKSFDQAIEELEKAMKGQPSMPPAPMPAPAPHAEPDEDNAGGPSDGDEDNEEEEEDEDEDEAPPAPPPPPLASM